MASNTTLVDYIIKQISNQARNTGSRRTQTRTQVLRQRSDRQQQRQAATQKRSNLSLEARRRFPAGSNRVQLANQLRRLRRETNRASNLSSNSSSSLQGQQRNQGWRIDPEQLRELINRIFRTS